MMLKLKLQCFGHLMGRVDSFEKTLMLRGIGGRRRRGRQRMRWLDGITDSMAMSLCELGIGDGQGGLACCDSWGCKESDTTSEWTELNWIQTRWRQWKRPNAVYSRSGSEWSCSAVSDSLQCHGLSPTRLLHLWNFPDKNTGVGFHLLLQGMFLTKRSNPLLLDLLHWQADSLSLCHLGSTATSIKLLSNDIQS